MLGKRTDFSKESLDHWLRVNGVAQVENILDHVVSEWILYQGNGIVGDLADESGLLRGRGMVYATLQNTAAMSVCSNCNTIVSDGIINELSNVSYEIWMISPM